MASWVSISKTCFKWWNHYNISQRLTPSYAVSLVWWAFNYSISWFFLSFFLSVWFFLIKQYKLCLVLLHFHLNLVVVVGIACGVLFLFKFQFPLLSLLFLLHFSNILFCFTLLLQKKATEEMNMNDFCWFPYIVCVQVFARNFIACFYFVNCKLLVLKRKLQIAWSHRHSTLSPIILILIFSLASFSFVLLFVWYLLASFSSFSFHLHSLLLLISLSIFFFT